MAFLRRALAKVFPTLSLRNSATVRYAFSFSFLFVFAALASMAAVTGSKGSYIKIVPSTNAVEVGTQFTLAVFVYADAPVNAIDINVLYPTDSIEVLGIDKGDSVITLWTEEPFVKDNTIFLQGGTYKRGFVGEHMIATINVKAKVAGSAQFVTGDVSLLAGDGKGTTIKADTSRAKITTSIFAQGEIPAGSFEGTATVILVTDIDGDGKVTLRDISSFMANWATKGRTFDFNNDGAMTFRDFSIILSDFFTQ